MFNYYNFRYQELEDRLITVFKYVGVNDTDFIDDCIGTKINSSKIIELLVEVSIECENLIRDLYNILYFNHDKYNKKKFEEIYSEVNKKLNLESKKLYLQGKYLVNGRSYLWQPFKINNELKKHNWYNAYNKIKHSRINEGFNLSNLKFLIDAMGSYFITYFYYNYYTYYLEKRYGVENVYTNNYTNIDFEWKLEKLCPFKRFSEYELRNMYRKGYFNTLSGIESKLFMPHNLAETSESNMYKEVLFKRYNIIEIFKLVIDQRYYTFFEDLFNQDCIPNIPHNQDAEYQIYLKLMDKPIVIAPNLPEEILGLEQYLTNRANSN